MTLKRDSLDLTSIQRQKLFGEVFIRVLWYLVSFIPFNLPGRVFSPVRLFLLRTFGAKIPSKALICSGVSIWFPQNLEIGQSTTIGRNVEIYNYSPVVIGSNTVVSQYTYICTASHDYSSKYMTFYSSPIYISSNVWIAASSMLCPGVSIGDGCVVGARSLVTSNLPPWTICVGTPAKVVKHRFLS